MPIKSLMNHINKRNILIFSSCVVLIVAVYILLTLTLWQSIPADKQIFQTSLDLFKQQDYKGAIEKSTQLIEKFPKSRYADEALFNIGAAHTNLQNYDGAREAYKNLLKKFPKSRYADEALFSIGAAHTNLQNYDGAREAYKNLLKKFPDSELKDEAQRLIAASFIDETKVLFNEKKYDQAYQDFDRLTTSEELKEYPNLQAQAMYNTALCLVRLDKTDEAFERFSKVTTQFRANELAANALRVIGRWNYVSKKDYMKSLSVFQELLKRFPKSDLVGSATVGVVLSSQKLNRNQDVQGFIKEFSEQFPENKWKEILELYAAGLKQASYSLLEITSWEKANVLEKARNKFNRILMMHSKLLDSFESLDLKGDVRYQIAQSYLAEQKYALAGLAFDKILTEEFSVWEQLQEQAMYQAAYCLKQQGIYDEALGRYLEFTNRFPESEHITDVYFDIGDIYAKKEEKDYDLARYNYNSALQRTTDSNRKSKIHFDFAATYYNQGDYKNTILEYNKWLSIEEYPKSTFTVAAKHLIANIHYQQSQKDNLPKNWLEKNSEEIVKAYQRVLDEHSDAKERVPWYIYGSLEQPNRLALCTYRISDIYYKLGTKYDKVGNTKLAIAYWLKALARSEKIISEYPTDDVVQYTLHNALLIHAKLGYIEAKTNGTLIEELDEKGNKYISKLKQAGANEILLAAARLKFANVKHVELKDYTGAAKEYAKLWNNYPAPHPRLNLIKLQGKYYEGVCYEEDSNSETSPVKTYREVTTLFKAAFQPLIDTPTIDVPNRDYYLAEATKIFQDLVSRHPKAEDAAYWQYIAGEFYADRKQFKEAIAEYEKVIKVYPMSEYAKSARSRLKEIPQKLKEKDSLDTSDNLDSSERSEIQQQLTAEEVAEIASGSTVFLSMNNGTGSGFFVGPGLIATNYHVIKGAIEGTARLVRTNREYAIVGYTAIDVDRDLAILKVRAFGVKPLTLGNNDDIHVNNDVYAVGNPLGKRVLEGTVSYGKISGIREDSAEKKFVRKSIQMTAPITPGNSGGPVISRKGEVVGVAVSQVLYRDPKTLVNRAQNLNFAVHVNHLKALLKRTGPPKPLSDLEIIY